MNGKPFLTPEMRERLCKYSFTLHDVADHVRGTRTVGYGIPSWTDIPMSPEPRKGKWHGLVHPHDTMEQFDCIQRRFLDLRIDPKGLKRFRSELDKLAMEEPY